MQTRARVNTVTKINVFQVLFKDYCQVILQAVTFYMHNLGNRTEMS